MSDNFGSQRPNSGNFGGSWHGEGHGGGKVFLYTRRRYLVEEAASVSIKDLQRNKGRQKILQAADNGSTIPISLNEKTFTLNVTYDTHRLPGRQERWSSISDGNVRLWLVCPSCRRRFEKLYIAPSGLSDDEHCLKCRKCARLVYMSQHCGRRKWWRLSAKPIRRLLRKRDALLRRNLSPNMAQELDHIDRMIWLYRQRAAPKGARRSSKGIKRQYRDVDLVFRLN